MMNVGPVYNRVIGELAICERKLDVYGKLAVGLPNWVHSEFGLSKEHVQARKERYMARMREYIIDGIPALSSVLKNATPLPQFYGQYVHTGDRMEAIEKLDDLVADDVQQRSASGMADVRVDRPYSVYPLSTIPVSKNRARSAIQESAESVAIEREALRNLARVLTLCMKPDLVPFPNNQGAGPRIDRLAITKEMIENRDWIEMTDIASKAMQPVSMDEHVADYCSKSDGGNTPQYSEGFALLELGKNTYGESKSPMYGIWNRRAYSRDIILIGNHSETNLAYIRMTTPQEDDRSIRNVRHTREGNFVGGCFSDDKYHPVIGATPSKEPWCLGAVDSRSLKDAVKGWMGLSGESRPDRRKMPKTFAALQR
jgi:hypothetical protein